MAHTVTSKGQVRIPRAVRERLGIRAGSVVAFELTNSGEVVLRTVAAGGRRVRAGKSPIAKLRGRATVRKMRTEEIPALTRGSR